MILFLSKEILPIIGADSLAGILTNHLQGTRTQVRAWKTENPFPTIHIALERGHGGPETLLVPEHMPMGICAGILSLQKLGWEVEIDEDIADNVDYKTRLVVE